MQETSVTARVPRRKDKSFTRRQRNAKRRKVQVLLKAERLADRAERRMYLRSYSMFFGCNADLTEALADDYTG